MTKPLFPGLVFDENDEPVELAYVGGEPFYVVNDAGFHRHIPSQEVDRQVLNILREQIKGNEELIAEQTSKMLGQDDIFTQAIIQNQLKQIEQSFEALFQTGIPEDGLAYMGMVGFKIVINMHGEVIRVDQPMALGGDEGGGE